MLHYTAMTGGPEPALKRLRLPETEVSCHYLVGEDGSVFRLVDDDRRAWHAGAGRWGASDDLNSRSLGIELSNDGASPFTAAQMDALEALLALLLDRHGIAPRGVIGHSDAAPGRKIDPGPRFDWRRLALLGLSIWPEPRGAPEPDPARFCADVARAGWTADVPLDVLLGAVRLRVRPWARGPLDATDMGLAADLARRFPVDADRNAS
ncbi:N-acetylmuramoyl-L-alanine amidase [Jannaschia ovalis]|uniref:N-acetylmuramoyl-L-alanine amidase n=1 Tax=Jannaschia ovalis TaxID=3038773 RepID=A0ABY8L9M6_9RHOB|nr:N-acetylmuramoyl-L-alanine amidase [Jannaschia sp. GRR-S6-38]WGH77821.1 N-acetylmuramoyl-L-alanine amidase [Jannaschia sp. GRR-S6-38]